MVEMPQGLVFIAPILIDALVGLIIGAMGFSLLTLTNKILPKKASS
jgi:hypothetical protein